MKLKHDLKFVCIATLITIVTSGIVACSSDTSSVQDEFSKAASLLNGSWDFGCQVNQQPAADPNAPTGYLRQTFEFNILTGVQTFEYFQDANCNVPVTNGQVANLQETFFLRKQSQQLALRFPSDKTTTDLGEAYYIDLQVISVAINDEIQSETELQQKGIVLQDLKGLYIVTDSDRLHISAATDTRPTAVPLGQFYTRNAD